MLEIFISLTEAAADIGTISSASMYQSGLITLDGADKNGKPFHITFTYEQGAVPSEGVS